MDSASQTSSADDDIIRSCSSICLSDTTVSETSGCCAKDLVEKLMAQLKEKDEKLEKNKHEITELLANMELEKTRAVEAATNVLNRELAISQQTILTFQKATWKSLTSTDLCYYIKVPSGPEGGYDRYFYPDNSGYLSAGNLAISALHTASFKFTNNSDGTFSIHSMSKERYLLVNTDSYQSAASFVFSSSQSKFVLFYDHQQQNKEPGILVDIYSLANGLFLSVGNQQNRVKAKSRTAPAKKFLLVPVE